MTIREKSITYDLAQIDPFEVNIDFHDFSYALVPCFYLFGVYLGRPNMVCRLLIEFGLSSTNPQPSLQEIEQQVWGKVLRTLQLTASTLYPLSQFPWFAKEAKWSMSDCFEKIYLGEDLYQEVWLFPQLCQCQVNVYKVCNLQGLLGSAVASRRILAQNKNG